MSSPYGSDNFQISFNKEKFGRNEKIQVSFKIWAQKYCISFEIYVHKFLLIGTKLLHVFRVKGLRKSCKKKLYILYSGLLFHFLFFSVVNRKVLTFTPFRIIAIHRKGVSFDNNIKENKFLACVLRSSR